LKNYSQVKLPLGIIHSPTGSMRTREPAQHLSLLKVLPDFPLGMQPNTVE